MQKSKSYQLRIHLLPLFQRIARSLAALVIAIGVAAQAGSEAQLRAIQSYIRQTWTTLTRSNKQLATAAADPKFPIPPEGRWPVYVSRSDDLKIVQEKLRRELPPADYNKIDIRELPGNVSQHGLLYLPFSYV